MGASLCGAVALFSARYLVGLGPQAASVLANAHAQPWLLIHVAGSATALLLGPFQFSRRLRGLAPRAHRWTGRCYVAGCMVGGAAGTMLALGAMSGWISSAGFGLLGLFWMATTAFAFKAAVDRRFVDHSAWMVRSFALTFAAVSLRIDMMTLRLLPSVPFVESYRAVSFLCWVPNLLVAEFWLRSRARFARGTP